MSVKTGVRLSVLARASGARLEGPDVEIAAVTHDSRAVRPGTLFVAIPGAKVDGMQFVPQALESGAVAVCATSAVPGTPTLVTDDPRSALALLAAELHGHPDREMALVGLTGSLGKTSTALLTEAALTGSGEMVGVIGSLGIRLGRSVVETGMTTPEAPAIHGALRSMVDRGARVAVMEVTSHSIRLRRVRGLEFAAGALTNIVPDEHLEFHPTPEAPAIHGALRSMVDRGARVAVMEVTSHSIRLRRVRGLEFAAGALTNIVPDEHLEFHPTPEHYIRTKMQFFDMLAPGAPLVVNVDDEVARRVTRDLTRPVIDVSADGANGAHVTAVLEGMDGDGSRFTLRVRRPLPGANGREVAPITLTLRIPLLGEQQVANAAIAATLALVVGAEPASIAHGLATAAPIRRRMQLLRASSPMVLDDTVGNPESIRAVIATARRLAPRRLRVVYALRGSRGPVINARNVRTLVELLGDDMLVVTEADESAGPRDRVKKEERDAACEALRASGREVIREARLDAAIERVLDGAGEGDLVLLLGAQGMDGGAEIVRRLLA